MPVQRIAREVEISLRYAPLIRRGECVPHPRLWEALRRLARAARSELVFASLKIDTSLRLGTAEAPAMRT